MMKQLTVTSQIMDRLIYLLDRGVGIDQALQQAKAEQAQWAMIVEELEYQLDEPSNEPFDPTLEM